MDLAAVEDKLKPFMGNTEGTAIDPLCFPDYIMTGAAGDFARVHSSYTEPPEHFYFMSFLACLGSLAGAKIHLRSEISPEPRLYLLILGESADDRKSTAISKTVSFFRETVTGFHVCHGIGSAEGLQKMLEQESRLLLCFDEFKQFTSKCKIESSVLMPCVTTLFESRHYESHTAAKSVIIEKASLSLLAACTSDTYEGIFDDHFLAIGFPNRLFLCPGKGTRKFSFPEPIPEDEKKYLKKRLAAVLSHIGAGIDLDITTEGRELFHQWYMALPQSIHSKRLDGYALRFMSLLSVNDQKHIIDADIVSRVIDLCDWQYRARRRFDPIDADSKMARMEEKIRRILESGPKTKRDLVRGTNANRAGTWIFETALQNLVRAQEIALDKKSGGYFLKGVSSPLSSLR